MIIALWIVDILTALAFLAIGGMKIIVPKATLRERGMTWTDGFAAGTVKLIGTAEVVGAIGLVVPPATGILPVLAPIAAVCLAALMVGAIVVHLRSTGSPVPAIVMLALSTVTAILGFLVVA